MRPDYRKREKNVKAPADGAPAKEADARRDLLASGSPSPEARAERARNDAALHLLDELETAVRASDEATAAEITADAAALGYVIQVVRLRNGVVRRIDFGPLLDAARAGAITAAALERRAKHEAATRAVRSVAVPEGAGAAPRPRAQYVAVWRALDGGKARR